MGQRRYKRWRPDYDLLICEQTYNMGNVHRFICDCFRLNVVDEIVLKHGVYETFMCYGMIMDGDEKLRIILDANQPLEQMFISALHEMFHVYFHDYENWNDEHSEMVEKRAEVSALNMLSWYHDHPRSFESFKRGLLSLKRKDLTKEELLVLRENYE
jgi:hypothetical protein